MDKEEYYNSVYKKLKPKEVNEISTWIHFNIKPIRYINKKLDIKKLYEKFSDELDYDIDDLIAVLIGNGYKYIVDYDNVLFFNISSSSKCFSNRG